MHEQLYRSGELVRLHFTIEKPGRAMKLQYLVLSQLSETPSQLQQLCNIVHFKLLKTINKNIVTDALVKQRCKQVINSNVTKMRPLQAELLEKIYFIMQPSGMF